MSDDDGLITVAEAAAKTGYTTRHITRLIHAGKIAGRRVGPIWLISLGEVEAYRRTDPKPGPRPGNRER